MSSIYLALPLMLLLTVVQAAVLPFLPIQGPTPQLVLLVAVAWGLLRGPTEGTLWGFLAGFFLDLYSISPMGIASLAAMTAVILTAYLNQRLPRSRFVLPLLLMALATLIFQIAYLTLLQLAGYRPNLVAALGLLPTAVLHALLMIPTFALMSGLERLFWPRRIDL